MREEPVGTWLCPSCSPNAAFYIKQLVKQRETPPVAPTPKKTAAATSSKGKKQTPVVKKEALEKKGVAAKKLAAKKPKSKWKGWVEMSSDGEEEFKEKVNAQWKIDTALGNLGKRQAASKAMSEEDDTGRRGVRTHSRAGRRKVVVETDSEEEGEGINDVGSFHEAEDQERDEERGEDEDEGEEEYEEEQEQETEYEDEEDEEEVHWDEEQEDDEQEPPVRRSASIIDISSGDSDDSEDTMAVDDATYRADKDSADELSNSPPSYEGDRHVSPDLAQPRSNSSHDTEDNSPGGDWEYPEDFMDTEYQDRTVEASNSNPSNDAEYFDAPTHVPNGREIPNFQSPSPTSRSASPSPVLQPSHLAPEHETDMDIDAKDEGQEDGESDSDSSVEVIEYLEALYFPESANRSTLPLLV